jgi:VIT1/CCC1 family predicted Fe2+/Mn2+ transporter
MLPRNRIALSVRLAAAAVLGANDGIIFDIEFDGRCRRRLDRSTSHRDRRSCRLVAGALSMAAGEYVSVSSQADTERAELDRERLELATTRPSNYRNSLTSTSAAG